mmetsp:Transcript_132868/g.235087  ORF Transcript_132868/g.235087 Transcript_132868/m.235087 type:complete len:450 (-) Transcript_132868:1045-2394(-)
MSPAAAANDSSYEGYYSSALSAANNPGQEIAMSTQSTWPHGTAAPALFHVREQASDGNCLFRSFSDQIYGTPEYHLLLRDRCSKYIASERNYFEQFIAEPFEEFIARIQREGEWGDDVEIEALSEIFDCRVEIYASHNNSFMRTFHETCGAKWLHPVRLQYEGRAHYNSLSPASGALVPLARSMPGMNCVPGEIEDAAIARSRRRQEAGQRRSGAAEADAEQTERDVLDESIRLSRLDFEHKSEAAARPAPAAERSVLAFDPEHPLFTIEGAVAACDDNGKLIANLYKEFHEHFSGEPRDASAHGDPDHPGLRAGEAVPEGLKSWDHTSKLRPDGKSKAGGWIASRPAPAQQGTKKVPDTAWFNINVWGSWRLAFLGARLQRELWLREQVQAVGALEAPMAVEATEAVAAPKPAEAPAAAEPTATEAKAAGRSTRGSQSTHSSRGAKGS